MKQEEYKKELRLLQIELVKLQRHIIRENRRILIIFEGRDASGKDGTIKRIVQHLSPRETRVVALGKPTEREYRAWYFQRYVPHLPVDGEIVLFNRSWYNRAGVEKVMGYCNQAEYDIFMDTVNEFEELLVRSGMFLIKYYLHISRKEQEKRLAERKQDPLTQWKVSPVDESALQHWSAYSKAHTEMLRHSHSEHAPWTLVAADHKKETRLNVIRDILNRLECPEQDPDLCIPDPGIIIPYRDALPLETMLAD
jgi:polyphosphate kinase 2